MSNTELPRLTCPACDYALDAGMEICPECGYRVQLEDRSLAQRRGVFLELTRVQSVGWPIGLFILAVWLAYGVPLVVLVPAIVAGFFVGADKPKMHRRLLRRVWMMLLGWMSAWWVGMCLGVSVVRWIWWDTYRYSYELPKFLSLRTGREGAYGGLVLPFVLVGVVVLTYFVWRTRWRRLCLTAGLVGIYDPPWKSAVLRWSFVYPPAAMAVLTLLGVGVVQVLDRFWPGWDVG